MSFNNLRLQSSYLRILKLNPSSNHNEKIIKKQFRTLAKTYHPDRATSVEDRNEATRLMKLFEEAKSWLVSNYVSPSLLSKLERREYHYANEQLPAEERRRRERKIQKERRKRREKKKKEVAEQKKREFKREQKNRKKRQIAAVSVTAAHKDSISFKWSCKEKADFGYVMQCQMENEWFDVYNGRKKTAVIKGLDAGTKYIFRLGVVNKNKIDANFVHTFEALTFGRKFV